MNKPRVGLLLFTAEWFAAIGATGGSFGELPVMLKQDAAQIEQALGQDLEVNNPGILATREQVQEAAKQLRQADVDALVVCQITWGEDWLLLKLVDELPQIPLLLWCYSPYLRLPDPLPMPMMLRGSGPVGALQASGPLKRMGKRFGFAFGSYQNPDAIRKITAFGRAAKAVKGLQGMRIGVLPHFCDQMSGTFVDENRLRQELGPVLKYISNLDYRQACDQVTAQRVEAFVQDLRANFRLADTLTDVGMRKAARVSLGLFDLAALNNLQAIAIEDVGVDLHRVVGMRPCLSVPGLFERAVVSMEADVSAAAGMWALREMCDQASMFTEIFTYDEQENALLMGHAGMHDLRLVENGQDVLIEPDGEYRETEPDSAWMRFRAKGGSVTMLSVFCDVQRFKFVISSGEAVAGPEKLMGSPHIYVKIRTPLAEFFEKSIRTGMTQHWIVVHGDMTEELLALANILGLDQVII